MIATLLALLRRISGCRTAITLAGIGFALDALIRAALPGAA